jgi:hypothetical protein
MSRKRKASGRSSSPFVMLHWMILDSQGWHDLSSHARLAYPEIVRKWRGPGSNNGRIAMSARDLALRIGCGKSTSARAHRVGGCRFHPLHEGRHVQAKGSSRI